MPILILTPKLCTMYMSVGREATNACKGTFAILCSAKSFSELKVCWGLLAKQSARSSEKLPVISTLMTHIVDSNVSILRSFCRSVFALGYDGSIRELDVGAILGWEISQDRIWEPLGSQWWPSGPTGCAVRLFWRVFRDPAENWGAESFWRRGGGGGTNQLSVDLGGV